MSDTTVDPDKLKQYSFQLFTKLEGAVTSGMVHLGDRYTPLKIGGKISTSPRRAPRPGSARSYFVQRDWKQACQSRPRFGVWMAHPGAQYLPVNLTR